ncbi:MAG: E3 binding domain-containing protein, partial [Solirubrobacterales bacterium]|nr:E3 binding domain-containing protein [Solirubrobacterales bacterium]
MSELVMPRLSDTMEEGTILRWLKSDGEHVARGEELVEIETDKATMTYESDQEGTLEIIAPEGSTLAVGEPIARVGAPGAATPPASSAPSVDQDEEPASGPASVPAGGEPAAGDGSEPPVPAIAPSTEDAPADEVAQSTEGTPAQGVAPATEDAPASDGSGGGEGERVKASPLARRIAQERGVDLHTIAGSGPGGRIVKADVLGGASLDAQAPGATGPAAPAPATAA